MINIVIEIYGKKTLSDIEQDLVKAAERKKIFLECFQSNHEGQLIEKIHSVENDFDGIIINPAAFTHTSIALLDALRATTKPKIEVHISNIYAREDYRRKSITSEAVNGIICGLGDNGYVLAIYAIKNLIYKENNDKN